MPRYRHVEDSSDDGQPPPRRAPPPSLPASSRSYDRSVGRGDHQPQTSHTSREARRYERDVYSPHDARPPRDYVLRDDTASAPRYADAPRPSARRDEGYTRVQGSYEDDPGLGDRYERRRDRARAYDSEVLLDRTLPLHNERLRADRDVLPSRARPVSGIPGASPRSITSDIERLVLRRPVEPAEPPPSARLTVIEDDVTERSSERAPHIPNPPPSRASTSKVDPHTTPPTSLPSAPAASAVKSSNSQPTPSEQPGSGSGSGSRTSDKLTKVPTTSFIVRPSFGTEGRETQLVTNYFAVRPAGGRGKLIHHYDVDVEPVAKVVNAKKPRQILRAVWEQLVTEQRDPAWIAAFAAAVFDGRRNALSPVEFPFADGVHKMQTAITQSGEMLPAQQLGRAIDDDLRRWNVSIKKVATIDLQTVNDFCEADKSSPQNEEACLTAVMAVNVLLRDLPSKRFTQVGATGNKFFSMIGVEPIANGAVVCKGFTQSYRYSSSGRPLLNIDLAFSAFLASGPALTVAAMILGPVPGDRRQQAQGPPAIHAVSETDHKVLKRKLRGARFTVTYRKTSRLFTVNDITQKPAEQITFLLDEGNGQPGGQVGLIQYYKEQYGVEITRPRLPCIVYGKKNYVPLEFARFTEFNSLPPTNLTAGQTAEMVKASAIAPQQRHVLTQNWRRELAYESQDKVAQWGLEVNKNMLQLKGRVLDPPRIQYRGGSVPIDFGAGSWRLRHRKFFRNADRPLASWSVVSFEKFADKVTMERFVVYLVEMLRGLGVEIANGTPPCLGPYDPRSPAAVRAALIDGAKHAYLAGKATPQLICVVLPGRDAYLYEQIKRMAFTELKAPVPTQCMQARKIRDVRDRQSEAYTQNLAMKVQSKLGGITHHISPDDLPGVVKGDTMILGADLGHPPFKPGSGAPTVACSIATYNDDCDAYSAQIRLQEGRADVIADLAGMVAAHLRAFQRHNAGRVPGHILLFRDGISEGQYAAALTYEHSAVLAACAAVEPVYRPRILVCVCAKRHITRFFGAPGGGGLVGRNGNLLAGTVVDQAVTHPYAYDFYLQAHAGMVGTARPTHYICLSDELGMTPDQLQKLVYGLCHSFQRCTTSVSLVPVCYIADLVCQKARIIVHDATSSSASESSYVRSQSGAGTGARAPAELDTMKVQRLLEKNPEMERVAWWM